MCGQEAAASQASELADPLFRSTGWGDTDMGDWDASPLGADEDENALEVRMLPAGLTW